MRRILTGQIASSTAELCVTRTSLTDKRICLHWESQRCQSGLLDRNPESIYFALNVIYLKQMLAQRQTIFAERDKNRRALAFLERVETPRTVVATIRSVTRYLVLNPREICTQFLHYYISLVRHSVEEVAGYIDGVSLPSLSHKSCMELDSPKRMTSKRL